MKNNLNNAKLKESIKMFGLFYANSEKIDVFDEKLDDEHKFYILCNREFKHNMESKTNDLERLIYERAQDNARMFISMVLNEGALRTVKTIPFPEFNFTIEELMALFPLDFPEEGKPLTEIEIMERKVEQAKRNKVLELRNELCTLKDGIAKREKWIINATSRQSEIRKEICEIDGHSWTPYLEREGFVDRTWEYHRYCVECDKTESHDEFSLPRGINPRTDICNESIWNKMSSEDQTVKILSLKYKNNQV